MIFELEAGKVLNITGILAFDAMFTLVCIVASISFIVGCCLQVMKWGR